MRVYFFAIVLSCSQMKFAYFARKPFTTATAIYAHELAFKFFNGRTQTVMYDLDRVFVINENYGDIVYVKAFEDYVRKTGYSTTMCRPRDPRTKGRVEALVGYIKGSFLEGRTNRFLYLKEYYPKLYDYCMRGGEFNEKGIWQPSKNGLGMAYVIARLNEMYSKTLKDGTVKKFITY